MSVQSSYQVVLLEGIHEEGVQKFKEEGNKVVSISHAWGIEELLSRASEIEVLGIRSKTELPKEFFEAAKNLLSIGCFCIGTNQVDLTAAQRAGVPVFNAPFSNTRSVAELTLAMIVMLARKASHKNLLLHQGIWDKSAKGCFEVRQKTIGIVGYGHIGPQVGLLAEAFGMNVLFYDIVPKLPLGNARAVSSLDELLGRSDFVTLHVPETPETKEMINTRELSRMRKGSYLLNLSRGSVVHIEALAEVLKAGHLAGAAVDVFPEEPSSNDEPFVSLLRGLPNVILTPHIGGSTEEAQRNIGLEVAHSLLKNLHSGSTFGAVNFPQAELPRASGTERIVNVHRNVPGVLKDINLIVSEAGVNVHSQTLTTDGEVGYVIMDVDGEIPLDFVERIKNLKTSLKTRVIL